MSIFPLVSISLIVIILDQAAKFAAVNFLRPSDSVPVINGIFHLTLVHNTGAAFGFLKGGGLFFIFISAICIVAIIWLLKNSHTFIKIFLIDPKERCMRVALGLILGGAIGNLIDRICYSYVIDFLDFRVWPVFNVADSAITIGGAIIFLKIIKQNKGNKDAAHSL